MDEFFEEHKVLALTLTFIAIFTIGVTCWVFKSGMEAESFNHITGKNVSTWDAMWVELRVQN